MYNICNLTILTVHMHNRSKTTLWANIVRGRPKPLTCEGNPLAVVNQHLQSSLLKAQPQLVKLTIAVHLGRGTRYGKVLQPAKVVEDKKEVAILEGQEEVVTANT